MKHVRIHITGIVQGVGMRPFVYREAVARGITGWVLNAGDGVHIEAHGDAATVDAFVRALREEAPAAASISDIAVAPLTEDSFNARDLAGFWIVASEDDTERTTLVSPDIATCPDCLHELFDPADRRYHYPFINCTNCGPRFTIIRSLPYDRAATSMDAFPMCPDCAHEYADPLDRRFHAQPDACFECGPHITWWERDALGETSARKPNAPQSRTAGSHKTADIDRPLSKDADIVGEDAVPVVGRTREASDAIIGRCAELLAAGGIVAIKGLGGFHLACNASSDAAVRELRRRKRRSNKPFAIMVHTVEDAETLCELDETEHNLLTGTVRPIVLLRRRAAIGDAEPNLSRSVAFDLPELGVMLPYTPLQHLLLAACDERGIRTLVMTSGNISEEPIETDDGLAWNRLVVPGIADALLGNDRAILSRYDDSVVRVANGAVQMVRRARGYAPRPLPLPACADAGAGPKTNLPTILACGPEQKATLAFTRELHDGTASCFLSQHIGDVENGATFDAWHATRTRFETLFDLQPNALVCDAHPRYLSSQWAREQTRNSGIPLVEVQHHHAHIASVIAESAAHGEHNPNQTVIGIAFDGTGAGARLATANERVALESDGTIWGGEFLIADLAEFKRVAHLKSWRLPGGAASVRDPRRNAFALLYACDLLDHPGAESLLASLTTEERAVTATMIERGLNSPFTSSMGRFLDAVAALLGICRHATYEGEPAILLEAAAHRAISSDLSISAKKLVVFNGYERFIAIEPPPPFESDSAQSTKQQERLGQSSPNLKSEGPTRSSMTAESYISVKNHHNVTQTNEKDGETEGSHRASECVIDLQPLLKRLLDGVADGQPTEALALLTHGAIASMTCNVVSDLAAQTGLRTVALSGGVFMNRLLLSDIEHGLEQHGFTVLIPHDVPVNDGCIAYGQAAVARAQLVRYGD